MSVDFDSIADQVLSDPKITPQSAMQSTPLQSRDSGIDYDQIADQVLQMQSDMATGNLVAGQQSNPDKTARSIQIAKQLGVAQPAVDENLPQYEQAAQLTQNASIVQQNPRMASFVANNPLAARIAQDDFDKLGFISKTWKSITSGANEAVMANQLGRLGSTKELAGALGVETPNTDIQIQDTQNALQQQSHMTGGYGAIQGFSGFISGLVDNFIKGAAPGAISGAALGTLVEPGAGTALGFGIGGVTGFNADMARVAAGNAYLKMNMMRDASGAAMSEPAKQFGALFTGAATYALGAYGSKVVGSAAAETAESLASKALDQALQRPTFTNALAGFAKDTALGGLHGGAIMTAMEGSAVIGEELAKAFTPADFKTDPEEIVNRLSDAFVNGALTLGVMHGAMAGIGLYGDIRNAQRAEAQMQAFKNMMDGAVESKTRDRSMDAFQSFMQHQTDGTPQENLYIPAETVRRFYQEAKVDPNLTDRGQDPLFGFVQDMPKQLEEAAKSGGDVVISTADYVTHLAGTPISEQLLPDIRLGANAMSVNEAKAYQAEYDTRMKVAMEEAASGKTAEPTAGQQIFQDIKQQILNAGRSDSEAHKVAAIVASRYVARAERLGVDPLQLYKESGPQIQKGDAADVNKFMQGPLKNPFLSFLGKTGVASEHQWDITGEKGKAGNRMVPGGPLFRKNGLNLDTLALSAQEHGFLSEADINSPNDNGGINKLSDMIRRARDGEVIHPLGEEPFKRGEDRNLPINLEEYQPSEAVAERWAMRDEGKDAQAEEGGADLPFGDDGGVVNPRGAIDFEGGKAIISLFDRADPSTLIHELGHSWLEELKADAARADAPEQLKSDWEVIKNYLKTEGEEISKDQHEQFARSVEAYVMEGKTPSKDLAGVFRRFKTWMTKLYGIISNLRAPINDEIRGVFDRLLATDEEIADVKASQGLEPAFKSKEDAGMTSAEWKAYNKHIDNANQQAESTLLEKMMKGVRRRRTAEYKEELAGAKEEAKTKIDQRPDIQALRLVTKGLMPDGSKFEGVTKLNRADMERIYGKQGLADLPKGVLSKDGLHPDMVAEILGYRTGDDMIQALKSLERQQRELQVQEGERRGIRQFLIDQEAERRIEEKHGDLLDEESMRDEALAAVHSEQQQELLSTELRYLQRLGTQALVERGQGRRAVKEVEVKARWDAAEADLIHQIEIAKSEGKSQQVIDGLKQKIGDLKEAAKWDAAEADLIREIEVAKTEGRAQENINALKQKLADLKMEQRQKIADLKMAWRWSDAEADLMHQIDMAKSEGKAQEKIDVLKQKLADQKMTERWNDAERNTNEAALKQSVKITREQLQNMRDHVDALMLDKSVEDIGNYRQYARAERKAAREVQSAILRKDFVAAAAAKQRQIFNMILFEQMRKASTRIERSRSMMEQLASKKVHKGIDQAYTNQIHDLINRFGFDSRRGEELERTKGETLEEFMMSLRMEGGLEPAVDFSLFDHSLTPFNELTYDQFDVLDTAVRSLRALGRNEKTITVLGEKEALSEVIDRVETAILSLGKLKESDYMNPKSAPAFERWKAKVLSFLRSYDGLMVKKESLFDQVDKQDPLGVMNSVIFRPLHDALGKRAIWSEQSARQFKASVDAMPKGWIKGLRDRIANHSLLEAPNYERPNDPRQTKIMTKADVISLAYNWGNKGNRARLLNGHGWDEGTAKAFLDANMTKEDWRHVQDVWDMFKVYQEPLDQLQVDVTGIGLDMVKPDPFDTPHGRMEGGYFPIVEDKLKSNREETVHEKRSANALFGSDYGRATTPQTHTIKRVGGDRPILIDMDITPFKIGQVIHDLAMRKVLIDVDKILSNPRIKSAFDAVFGKEYGALLRPWLRDIANARNIDDASVQFTDRVCAGLRTNAVIMGVGFRISTILKHDVTALMNSAHELGSMWLKRGAAEFYGSGMTKKWEFIKEKSPEMAFRLTTPDKDIQRQYANILRESGYTRFKKQVQNFSTATVSYLDLASAAPTWLGAYRKALHEGMEDADAVYYANKTVRNAHGAQTDLDRAPVQDLKGFGSLLNMFGSFTNHIYNRQRLIAMDAASGVRNVGAGRYREGTRDFGNVLARSLAMIAWPGLISAIVKQAWPDENKDETWAGWAAEAIMEGATAGLFVVRDLANAAIQVRGHGYEMSPVAHAVNTIIDVWKDAEKMHETGEAPKNMLKHEVEAAGYISGFPTSAPFTAGKFLWDVSDGEADPQNVSQWLQGVMTGKIKDD